MYIKKNFTNLFWTSLQQLWFWYHFRLFALYFVILLDNNNQVVINWKVYNWCIKYKTFRTLRDSKPHCRRQPSTRALQHSCRISRYQHTTYIIWILNSSSNQSHPACQYLDGPIWKPQISMCGKTTCTIPEARRSIWICLVLKL